MDAFQLRVGQIAVRATTLRFHPAPPTRTRKLIHELTGRVTSRGGRTDDVSGR
jgi:hypothetical protein